MSETCASPNHEFDLVEKLAAIFDELTPAGTSVAKAKAEHFPSAPELAAEMIRFELREGARWDERVVNVSFTPFESLGLRLLVESCESRIEAPALKNELNIRDPFYSVIGGIHCRGKFISGSELNDYRKACDCLANNDQLWPVAFKEAATVTNYGRRLFDIYGSKRIFDLFGPHLSAIFSRSVHFLPNGEMMRGKADRELLRFLRTNGVRLFDPTWSIWSNHTWDEHLCCDLDDLCQWIIRKSEAAPHHPDYGNSGLQFELDCQQVLSKNGYSVITTPASGDFGVDLVVERDELRYAIQCKNLNRPVGIKAVQEVATGRKKHRCDFGVVVAPFGFTSAARELAHEHQIALILPAELARLAEFFRDQIHLYQK